MGQRQVVEQSINILCEGATIWKNFIFFVLPVLVDIRQQVNSYLVILQKRRSLRLMDFVYV